MHTNPDTGMECTAELVAYAGGGEFYCISCGAERLRQSISQEDQREARREYYADLEGLIR